MYVRVTNTALTTRRLTAFSAPASSVGDGLMTPSIPLSAGAASGARQSPIRPCGLGRMAVSSRLAWRDVAFATGRQT